MEKLTIRNLTMAERQYIEEALRTLYLNSAPSSNARWAANVMLDDGASFVNRLMLREKE